MEALVWNEVFSEHIITLAREHLVKPWGLTTATPSYFVARKTMVMSESQEAVYFQSCKNGSELVAGRNTGANN